MFIISVEKCGVFSAANIKGTSQPRFFFHVPVIVYSLISNLIVELKLRGDVYD